MQLLAREEIFDAVFDDEAFAVLPQMLAERFDARSSVLHWEASEPLPAIWVHNGYFASKHFDLLGEDFDADDIWSNAMFRPENRNRVMICDQIVPTQQYATSRLYNEWNRAIGDDTMHALGIGVVGAAGTGCIGLHRGPSRGAFDERRRHALSEITGDLIAMLRLRARLRRDRQGREAAVEILDGVDHCCIALDPQGRLRHANAAARVVLDRRDGLAVIGGMLVARPANARQPLAHAIAAAAARDDMQAGYVAIPREGAAAYRLCVAPLRTGSRAHVLVSFDDPDRVPVDRANRLIAMYGLAPSEAAIATALAQGLDPRAIADQRQVALGTVRVQIKSIARKMECSRQTEIAAKTTRLLTLR